MRICADDGIPRNNKTFFGKKCVFYAHSADIVKMCNFLFVAEVTAHLTLNGGFDVLVRCEVIHNHGNLIFIINRRKSELVKFSDRNRRSDVVAENPVKTDQNKLSGFYRVEPGMSGKDFLCHCHWHKRNPLFEMLDVRN